MTNKEQDLNKQVAELLGVSTTPQLNMFGTVIGEQREVVIRYQVGNEKNAEIVSLGDSTRSMEDSLAVAYGLGRLVQASTSDPDTGKTGIDYRLVTQQILKTIANILMFCAAGKGACV